MRFPSALVVFAIVLAAPAAARASEACVCTLGIEPLGFDPKAVPTNVNIFIQNGIDHATLALEKTNGGSPVPVPFQFEGAEGATGDAWLVPDAPLEPNTEYNFKRDGLDKRFTTGPGEDNAAPAYSSAAVKGASMGGACEEHLSAWIESSAGVDDSTPPTAWIWQVTMPSLSRTVYLSPVNNFYLGRMLTDDPSWRNCLNNVSEAQEGETYEATIVAFDWARNASAPATNSFQFEVGGSSGCGCDVAGVNASGGAAFASIAAALALSRSRRRRA